MSSQGGPKLAGSEPMRSDSKRDRRRGASGRAAALRRAPSDSDCSGETASLSADSGDRAVRPPPPPPAAAARKRGSRRRGSEWEVLEGLKDGQRFDKRPEVFNGYLHKKRKWPLKGWHKRFFVVDGGILVYARSPTDVARGRLHGSVDVGLSVISAKARRRRIDIDADEFIYHLRAKTPDVFRTWLNVLKAHRLYRQHLLTFGAREAAPKINAPDDLHATDTSSRESFSSLSEESGLSLFNKKESRSLPEFLSTIQNIYYDELMKIKRDGFNQTAENESSEDCNKPCQSNNNDEENNHNACHEKRPLVNAQIDCNFVTNQNTHEVDHISKIDDDRKEYKNQMNIPLHVILTLDQINKYETNKKAKKKTNESKVMFLEQATNPMATCFYFSSKNKLKLSSARLNSVLKKSKKSVNLPKYKNYSSEPPAKKLMSKGLLKDDSYQPTVDIKDFFPLTSDVYSEPLCFYCEKTSSEFKRLTDKLMESLYREKISDKRFDDLSVSAVSEIIKDLYNVHPSKETNPIILLFKCLLEYWIQHNSSHQIQQGKSYKSTYQQSDFTMLHYEYNKRHLEPSPTSYRNRRCDFRQYIDSTRRINYILQPYTESRKSNPFDRDPDSFEKDRRIQELEQLLKNTVYACETVASIISKENAEQISKSIIDSIQMNTDKISASTDLSNSTNVKVSSEIQKLEHALRILSQENLPQIALKEILQICLEIISRESFKTQNKNKPITPESLCPTRCSELGYVKLHEKRKISGNNSNSPQRKNEKLQERIHDKILNKSDESKKANSPISPCDKGKSYTKVPRFQTVETPTLHHLDGSGKDDEKDKQIIIDFSKYDLIEIRMNDNPQKTESLSINLKRKEKSYDKYSMANTVPCNPTKFVNDVPVQRNPLKKHTISQKSRLPLQVEKEIQSKVWQSDFSANTFSEIPKKIYNSNKNLQKMDTGSETETINKFEKTTCIQLDRQLRDAESNTVRKPTPNKKSGSPLPMVGKYVYKTKYCTEKNEKEQIVEKIYDSTNWNSIAGKSENKTLLTYNCNIPDKDKRSNQSENSSLQSQPQDSNDSTTRKLNKVSNQQSENNQSIQPTVKSLNNNETNHTDSDMQQLQETNESDPGILKQLYDEQKDSGDENPLEDNTITLEKLIDEQSNFNADATSLPKTSKPSEIQQKESGDEKPAKSKITALQKLIAEQNTISADAPSLPKTRKPSQISQKDSGDRESAESNKTALQKLLDEQKSANAYASSLPKTRKKIMPQNKQPIVSNTGELQKNVDQQSDTNGLTPSTLKTSTKSYESPKTNQLDPLPENVTFHNTTHQQSSEPIGTNTDDFTEPPGENNLTDILRPPNLRKVENQVRSSITEEQTQLPQSATLHETKETNTDELKKFIDDNIDTKVPPTSILESNENTIKSSKTTSHETRETNTDESKQLPEHYTGTKVLAPTLEIKISKTNEMNPITKSVTSHRLSHVSSMTNKDNFKKPLDQKDLIGDLTPSTLTKVEKPVRFSMTNQFDRLSKTKTNEFNTFGTNTDNFEKPLDQNNRKDFLTPSYLTKDENPVGSSVTKELTQLSNTKETNTDEFNKFIDDNIGNKVLTPLTLETIEKPVKSSNTNENETRETKTVELKYLLEDHIGSNDFITSTLATSENPVKASKTNLMKSAEYSKSKQPTRLSESVRESTTDETKDARGDEFKNLIEHNRGTNETLLTLETREIPEKNSKTHQVDPINNSATSQDPSGTNTEDFKKPLDLKNTADVFESSTLTKGEKPVRVSMTNEFDDTRASEFNKFLDDNIGINEAAPSSIETNENKRTPSKTSQLTRMSISHSTRMSRSQSHRLSHLLTHRLSRDPTKFNTDDLKKPFDENVNVRSGTNKGNYKKPLDEKSDANKTNVKSSVNYQPKRRLTESDTSLKQRPSRKSNVGDLRNLSTYQSNMSVFTPSSPETHMNKVNTLKNKPLNVPERQAPQPSASYTRELLKLLEEQSALSITSESGKPSDKPVESASGNPSKKLRVSVPQAPYRRPSNTNVLQQLLDQNGNEIDNNSAPEQPLHLAKKRWRKKKNTPPPNNTDQPPNTEPSNTKKFKKIINSAVVTPIKQVKSSMDSRHKKAKNSSSSRLVPETSPSETNKNQQNTADNPIFLSINSAKSEPKIRSLNSNAQGNYYQKIDPDDIDEKFVMMLLEDVAHISKNMPKLNKDIKSLVQKLKKKSNKHMKCFCPPGLHLLGNIYKGNNVVYTPASFAIGTQYTEDNIQPTNKTNDSIKITVSKGVSNTAAASENTVGASGESNVNELSNVNQTDIKSAILSQGFTEIVSIDSEIQTKQVVRNESTITEELTYKSVSNDAETNTQQPRSHTVNRLIEYFLETNSQGMRILRPRIQCVHGFNTNLLSSMTQDLSTTPQQEVHKGVKPIPMSLKSSMATGMDDSNKEKLFYYNKTYDTLQLITIPNFEPIRIISRTKCTVKCSVKNINNRTVLVLQEENGTTGLLSPSQPTLKGPQAGFVSGTPGGRLAGWSIEPGTGLESASRELGQAQLSVQQLRRLLHALERQPDTDVSLEGASPNVKKDRRKFGLRKKKSSSKCASVELAPPHLDGSASHMALSALTAPPSPGGGASSVPNSAASLPIAFLSTFLASTLVPCAAARPQSLPAAEGGATSLASLTPPTDLTLRDDFTVLAKDLVHSFQCILSSLTCERNRIRAAIEASETASPPASVVASLRTNLTSALQQNSELRTRLARIHDASDVADLSAAAEPQVNHKFQQSPSYSSSCVSASEFFDAEEHEDELKPRLLPTDEAGVIELDGDSTSEAGSLSSEEGSASSDNSDAMVPAAPAPEPAAWSRRSCLPRPRAPAAPSLWNLLYKNIGKDLSQVSMPVTINEPLNVLQRLCEELEYSELIDAAAACADPVERMCMVAAFAVSAYASSDARAASKPFNPLLHETYACVRADRGLRALAEQVSHHPPVSCVHAESPRWEWWQDARIKTKFWGKSMEFQPAGQVNLRLKSTGDLYTWNKVTTCVHNLFGGQRWVDQYGDMVITCQGTDISCKLHFIKASSWSNTRHEVRGAVSVGDSVRLRLHGRWSDALYCGSPRARCLWRRAAMPPDYELYYGFTQFAMELNELEPGMADSLPPTDTRFRPDQRALEEGDIDAAEEYKMQLEQAQRDRRRDNIVYSPRWFKKVIENGQETWVFTGEYWKCAESGFPDDLPRLW